MTQGLDNIVLIMQEAHGKDISMFESSFLGRSVEKRITASRCNSVDRYVEYIKSDQAEMDLLFSSLFIPFSEFFRNPMTFAMLEQVILPVVIQNKIKTRQREIRIWSAACAAGQEAYSIAIILEELLSRPGHQLNYRIFATDKFEYQVEEARKGRFSDASLGKVSMKRFNRWFTNEGNLYTVHPALSEHIDFSVHDLLNHNRFSPPASIFGDFDLIFCANLLFYYKRESQELIIKKIGNCLVPGGYLITGETEREILSNYHCREIYQQSAIFQV